MQTPSEEKPQAALTLRFTEWQCGHHARRPTDIPVNSLEQAKLILEAISHAISQSGHARAVILDDTRGIGGIYSGIYVTDDYVDPDFKPDDPNWSDRPVVIYGDAEAIAKVMAPELYDASDSIFMIDFQAWDGAKQVDSNSIVTTTLSPAEVLALIEEDENAYPPRQSKFELPPVFRAAVDVLPELEHEAADIAAYEADRAASAA